MCFLAIFLQISEGGGGTKDPYVPPSNDGKVLIPGWYALNGPFILRPDFWKSVEKWF